MPGKDYCDSILSYSAEVCAPKRYHPQTLTPAHEIRVMLLIQINTPFFSARAGLFRQKPRRKFVTEGKANLRGTAAELSPKHEGQTENEGVQGHSPIT